MALPLNLIEQHFEENFASRSELGASISIWQRETEVISLHGGKRQRDSAENDWTADTLVPIWSATKGPAALSVLLALRSADLSQNDPVKSVWPELNAAADGLTFAQLLAHQSGLAGLSSNNRPNLLEHEKVVQALEQQAPYWLPGQAHGYHPRTSGALMDEVVRRVTNISLGQFWLETVAQPLEIDLFIGDLEETELNRLATIYPPREIKPPADQKPMYQSLLDPESISYAAFASPAGMRSMSEINKPEFLQCGVPSFGGVASARGLAKFYAILANHGLWQGQQVFPESMVDSFSQPISKGEDRTLLLPTAFSCGFMLDPVSEMGGKLRHVFGKSTRAFGQPGAGGSHAFADPDNGLAFAYVMNQMESGILPNEKSLGIVSLL